MLSWTCGCDCCDGEKWSWRRLAVGGGCAVGGVGGDGASCASGDGGSCDECGECGCDRDSAWRRRRVYERTW